MSWTSLGPSNIGGCMQGVAVDFSRRDRIYAAASGGGVWHLDYTLIQTIFGSFAVTGWLPLTDGQPLLYVTAVASCRHVPRTVYYATGRYDDGGWPARIWRSDDAGGTWQGPSFWNFGYVYKMVVDPDDPLRVYVASMNGLWGSSNGGLYWTQLYPGRAWDVAMDPDDPAVLYAGIKDVGLVKTLNARPRHALAMPTFWRVVWPWSAMPSPSMIRIGVGGLGGPDHRVVAVKFGNEVRVHPASAEDASLWVSKGTPGSGDRFDNLGQNEWDHTIAVDPFDDQVILAGAQMLYRTDDGGTSWTKVAGYGTDVHPDQQQVVFDPVQPGVVYLANDGGIWGSHDSGVTWSDLSSGLVTAELFRAGVSGGAAMADMYHEGFVGTTDPPSTNWTVYEGGSPWEWTTIVGDPKRPGRFFVLGNTLGLHWLTASVFGPDVTTFNENIGDFRPLAIEFDLRMTSNTIAVGTDDGRIMRALDGDSDTPTWTEEQGIPQGEAITGIAMVPAGARLQFGFRRSWQNGIWAVNKRGELFSKSDINDNVTWHRRGISKISADAMILQTYEGKRAPVRDVAGLAVDAELSGCVYLLRWDGIEMTPDGGSSWSTINGSGTGALPSLGLLSIFAHPTKGSTLIVAAANGMYISLNRGGSWRLFGDGLPSAPISHAFMVGGTLYACSIGRGLWKRNVAGWGTILGSLRDASQNASVHASSRHSILGSLESMLGGDPPHISP